MKAIRQNWGGLWLWITTEVNEKNITQKENGFQKTNKARNADNHSHYDASTIYWNRTRNLYL